MFIALLGDVLFCTVAQGFYHCFRHVGVGFKTTLCDVGADGGSDVCWVSAVGQNHGIDALFCDAGGGATPTGVDGAYCSGDGVMEQNGDTVCREYYEGQIFFVCYEPVCVIRNVGIEHVRVAA